MHTLALLLASTVAAVLALTVGPARPANGVVSSALCAKGSVKAVIAGRSTCLKSGAKCRTRYAGQYRKHGFVCKNGKLARARRPAPTGPVYPKVPPLPNGPAPTSVNMPAAAALPAGATTISLPASAWVPDITDLALTPDAVWVSSGPFRIDPGSNAVSGPFSTVESQDIGTGEGSVWVSNYNEDTVRRFDAATGNQTAVVKLPAESSPEGIVDAGGAIWVATHHGGTVVRIDPATNRVAATVVVTTPGPSGPQGIAAGLGSVWVDVPKENAVFRIDPATNKIAAIIPLPDSISPCGGIAVGQTAVWVTGCLEVGWSPASTRRRTRSRPCWTSAASPSSRPRTATRCGS